MTVYVLLLKRLIDKENEVWDEEVFLFNKADGVHATEEKVTDWIHAFEADPKHVLGFKHEWKLLGEQEII
jgi:hypothetical protein